MMVSDNTLDRLGFGRHLRLNEFLAALAGRSGAWLDGHAIFLTGGDLIIRHSGE